MSKRKIAMMVFSAILTSNILPSMTASVDEYSNDEVFKSKKQKSNVIISKADFTDRRNYERYEEVFKIEEVIMFPEKEKIYKISLLAREANIQESMYIGSGKYRYNEIIFTYEDGEIDTIIIYDTEESPYNGYINKCSLYSSLTNTKEDFEILGVDKHIYINIDFTIIKVGIEDIKVYDKKLLAEETLKLDEIVSISDIYLSKAIKNNLDILSNEITLGDMYKLKELCDFSGKISDLKDLEMAKNLEKVNLNYSAIKDLSPLKKLKKLKEVSIVSGFIKAEPICINDDYIEVMEDIIDIDGKRLFPKEIIIEYENCIEVIEIEKHIYNDEVILGKDIIKDNAKSIVARYKENDVKFQTQVIYEINNK